MARGTVALKYQNTYDDQTNPPCASITSQ